MRKIAALFLSVGVFFGAAAFAQAPALASSDNHPSDLPNGTHLKVDICHNVDHNPVVVHVSVDAADYPFDTGHGDLTLNEDHGFVSFVPHTETGGHEHDFVIRVYTKHGNDETNTYVSERACEDEVTTTTTEPPVVTTTTESPVVTTTTEPPVVTTTTTQPTTVVTQPPATDTPAPVDVPKAAEPTPIVAAPVAALPGDEALAETGSWSSFLALVGAAAGFIGLGLLLMFRRNGSVVA